MRELRIEGIVAALAAVVVFGTVIPDLYVVSDDAMMTQLLTAIDHAHPTLIGKVWAVVFKAAAMGHFTPTHQTFKIVAYDFAGVEGWARTVLAFYLGLHAASAIVLCALLRRLGAPRHAALLAAAAFVLHPVFGEPLSCALYAYNVPGLFFLLTGCLSWCPRGEETLRFGRLATGTLMLILSMGCNPNMLITAPLMMGFMAIRRGIGLTRLRQAIPALVCVGGGVALTAAHRILAYGTLKSKQTGFENIQPSHDIPRFVREFLNGSVMLAASDATTKSNGSRNPSILPQLDFTVHLWSWEFLGLLAIAAVLCVIAVMAARREHENPRVPGFVSYARPFLFGVALIGASVAPYFLFIGVIATHRYLYPSVAGTAVVVVTAIAFIAERLCGPRLAPSVTAAVMAPILVVLLLVDRAAVKSIAYAHRYARALVKRIADDLEDEPEVRRLYVLGYPRVVGRAGVVYDYEWALRRIVSSKLERRLQENDRSLLSDIESGEITTPLPRTAAVFAVLPGGNIERVPATQDLSLTGPMARLVWDDHFSSVRLPFTDDIRELLASSDPRVVSLWIESLARRHSADVQYAIALTLRDMTAEYPLTQLPDGSFAALAIPGVRANAIRALAHYRRDFAPVARDAWNDAAGSPAIRSAVVAVAPAVASEPEAAPKTETAVPLPAAIVFKEVAPWRIDRAATAVNSLFIAENRDVHPLPRSARVTWQWFRAGESAPLSAGSRLLHRDGLAAHSWRRIPLFVRLPSARGNYDLEISIDASGRRLAGPARIRNLGIDQ